MSDTKRVSYLWFGGPDGWQVTSFDPRTDSAIGFKGSDVSLWINLESVLPAIRALEMISNQIVSSYSGEIAPSDRARQALAPLKHLLEEKP